MNTTVTFSLLLVKIVVSKCCVRNFLGYLRTEMRAWPSPPWGTSWDQEHVWALPAHLPAYLKNRRFSCFFNFFHSQCFSRNWNLTLKNASRNHIKETRLCHEIMRINIYGCINFGKQKGSFVFCLVKFLQVEISKIPPPPFAVWVFMNVFTASVLYEKSCKANISSSQKSHQE